jgi:3-methyl-2-oxobutanoate hydroxymethyltransferase
MVAPTASSASSSSPARPRAPLTVPALGQMARDGRRIAMLTAYDATLAAAADRAGVDVLLVGDSLGMVVQGRASTLPVSLDDVLYHTRCVAAARGSALVIADLPFGTYSASVEAAYTASPRR